MALLCFQEMSLFSLIPKSLLKTVILSMDNGQMNNSTKVLLFFLKIVEKNDVIMLTGNIIFIIFAIVV